MKVQVPDNPKTKFQEHATNNHVMILSCRVFSYGIAISLMTLGSSIIGSSSYLSSNQMHDVPRHPKNIPRHPKRSKTSQNRTVKTVNRVNCKTMTTVKTVAYIVQWVHMCPTACNRHQTNYKWKQLTSNPKQWHEHLMNWNHKTWKSKTVETGKHPQNYEQLLQDDWTASANRTGSLDNGFLHSFCMQLWINSFCCFLDGFCTEMYTANNKMQEITKQLMNMFAIKFKWYALKFPKLTKTLQSCARASFGQCSKSQLSLPVNLETQGLFFR